MSKKILIIGSGGREHAIAWKISQSPQVEKIFIAPGNAGTSKIGENIAISATDLEDLVNFAVKGKIDLTVVTPDDPLALGLVDKLKDAGMRAWGPIKLAAEIESSKSFAKDFMKKFNIPTADFRTFQNYDQAWSYVQKQKIPIVIKASGLALGKGVIICQTLEEAEKALKDIMVDRIFGSAGDSVVVEEYLEGPEISIHVFCDGGSYKLFPSAQDHKPIFDNDEGPNTGGMGAIAPVPWISHDLMDEIEQKIVKPTVEGLVQMRRPFTGVLFPGLKITPTGPKVLEYNARFGDPEAESYMRLLKTDLIDIFEASIDGKLNDLNIEWHPGFACCVMTASGGYPGKYEKGFEIKGIEEAEANENVIVFHAGTTKEGEAVKTSGGRVLSVTATGKTLKETLDAAYKSINLITFKGMYYRKDIGAKSLGDSISNY